jgi:hypothetical protein
MAAGPSKEELEMYWQNSRQYFDELAKHYQQADPAYYKEFIQPFYSNPFRSQGGSQPQSFSDGIYDTSLPKKKSGGARIAALGAMAVLAAAGAAVYLIMGNTGEEIPMKKLENTRQEVAADTSGVPKVEEPKLIEQGQESSPDFIMGEKLYKEKNYDMAEKMLRRVPRSSKDYGKAINLLRKIANIKLNSKDGNNTDIEKDSDKKNDRNVRRAPINPVR